MAKLSDKAMAAAKRIAARQGVPVEKVLAAYRSAAKNFKVNSKSLFLG